MTANRRSAAMIGLVLIILLLGGCAEVPPPVPAVPAPTIAPATSTPVPPTATPEPTETPTPLAAKTLLQSAFDASQQASSYRFEMDMLMTLSGEGIKEGTTIPLHFTGDAQPPDRVQGSMITSANNVEVETQVIVIEKTNYIKNPLTGRWLVNPQPAVVLNPEDLMMQASDIQELKLLGEETVDETPAYHLAGRAKLPFNFEKPLGKMEADMLVDYWIGQDDRRLVRSAVAGDMAFTGEVTATATISMTMRVFDYDVPMAIAAPEILPATSISVPGVAEPITITATLLPPLAADTPEGHVLRGLTSLTDGRFGLARAHFSRALELRPGWAEALLYRGAALAIDGDMDAAFTDLDAAIEAEPGRADAYALRAWAHLRALMRDEADSDAAISDAREDITRALELDPGLTAAAGLKATTDVLEAENLYDSDQAKGAAQFETAMADLEAVLRQDPDAASGSYLPMLQNLAWLKAGDRAWLSRQVDEADAQLAQDPRSYAAYAARGLAKLLLGSQQAADLPMLREAGNNLLLAIALVHQHMPDLADPAGGPLQVARIWDLQEAAYASGNLYTEVFFKHDPRLFPEFAQMLTSYWELQDLFIQFVDDPEIFGVAFSPDGRQIATLSESGPSYLRIWDATTGEKLAEAELGLDGQVIATTAGNLAYSPDGKRIVVAYTNPVVRVVDAETGEVTLEIKHDTPVHSAAFSPDGKTVVTVDPDTDTPILWDAETGKKLLDVKAGSPVAAAAFSPDGRKIAGLGEKIQLWDAETGETLATLPGYDSRYANAPAFSPDGKLLVVPGYPARVHDLIGATELFTMTAGARTTAFSPDGGRIAAAGYDAAGVWDARTGDLVFLAGHPFGADSAAFSPDGRLLVTGGPDGRFRVWDMETGVELWNGMAATLWWEATNSKSEGR